MMNGRKTVIFTSGAGQYYRIEAVANILENFSQSDYDYFRAYIWGQNRDPKAMRAYIEKLVSENKIEVLDAVEINCDTTRRGKVTASDTQNLSDAFLKEF